MLVHGFRGNHEGLEWVVGELRKIYSSGDIFTLDIPPFGKAGGLNTYFPRDYADFMAEFIRRKGLEKPILVGHSMGSLVVAATAYYYPELVNKKVVLLAPISKKTNKFFTQLQPLATKLPNKTLGYITTRFLYVPKRWDGKETIRGVAEKMRGDDAGLYHGANNWRKYRETLELTYRGGAEHAGEEEVIKAAEFATSYEIGDFPLGERSKVLLLAGEKDRLIPKKQTEVAARKLGYKAEFIEGAGHLLNYEKPAEVARRITRFLEDK